MKLKKNVVLREVAGDFMLIPLGDTVKENYGIFALTQSGAVAFKAITEGKNEEEILDAILDEFEVEREVAEKDLSLFLKEMTKLGII